MAENRPLCDCGRPAALKKVTDAGKATYGRWFWGCKNFNDSRKPCRFFEWYGGDDDDQPELGKVSADLQKVPGSSNEYRCALCQQDVAIGGQHVCRAYGTYQCSCGNRWTSGYSWAGNAQQCKRCGQGQEPESSQPLQRVARRGGSGRPHNAAMCGMCQALGYPCNLAAQTGAQPGFVQQQQQQQQAYSSYGMAYTSYAGSYYRPF
ncbi:hypothetical protein OEZ86_004974 [Tetradesmus obliquus]|nr:hypothetical protein OEZ86_004974 [Tetradesmus obliquus]